MEVGTVLWIVACVAAIAVGAGVAVLVGKVWRFFSSFQFLIALARRAGKEAEQPQPKSVGGATSVYLPQVRNEFPEFHAPDAEAAIKTFLTEYLRIKYEGAEDFEKARINENILLNIQREEPGELRNLSFHGISIYNFTRAREYATITYRVSLGFDLNGARVETRYELWYTLQLMQYNTASYHMSCPNCGGTFDSSQDRTCPYCDSEVIKDTILHWVITKAVEI